MYDLIDFMYYVVLIILIISHVLFDCNNYKISIEHSFFFKPIIFLFISLVISSISGYAYHNQNPLLALLAMRYFSYFFIYYILVRYGVKKDDVIKTVIIGAFIYMLVFALQVYLYPKQIVPFDTSTGFSRGFLRLRLEGVGFVTLTAFYSLNRFLLKKKDKTYLLLFFICFIYIFILGFRTLLVSFMFSSLLLVFFNSDSFARILSILTLIGVFLLILWQVEVFRDFVLNSIIQTDDQVSEGDEYIRLKAFQFLFEKVNVDFGSLFFGNGHPFEGTKYGNLVLVEGAKKNGFISADLGLLGFVFNYGILSVIAFLNIFRVAIFKRNTKESFYIKVFFIYLIMSSITTAEIFRAGMFGVEVVALYLYSIISYNNKIKEHD